MTSNQQFAIVPIPAHPGHAKDFVQADAILIGDMAEAMTAIRQSVSAQALLRRLDQGQKQAAATERLQAQARTRQILTFCDSVGRLGRRLDAYEAELAIRRQRAADEAEREEQERIQAQLDELPDVDDPAQHLAGGELSPLPAKAHDDQTTVVTRRNQDLPQVAQPTSISLHEA